MQAISPEEAIEYARDILELSAPALTPDPPPPPPPPPLIQGGHAVPVGSKLRWRLKRKVDQLVVMVLRVVILRYVVLRREHDWIAMANNMVAMMRICLVLFIQTSPLEFPSSVGFSVVTGVGSAINLVTLRFLTAVKYSSRS